MALSLHWSASLHRSAEPCRFSPRPCVAVSGVTNGDAREQGGIEMSDKKTKGERSASSKKRKILADLHSGMVLLARFADQADAPAGESDASGSRRSQDVRRVLNAPTPPSKHRWN